MLSNVNKLKKKNDSKQHKINNLKFSSKIETKNNNFNFNVKPLAIWFYTL